MMEKNPDDLHKSNYMEISIPFWLQRNIFICCFLIKKAVAEIHLENTHRFQPVIGILVFLVLCIFQKSL